MTDSTKTNINLKINNKDYNITVNATDTLLDILRNHLHLTGTKYGCGEGECGACSVIMDNVLVNSCLVLAVQAEGKSVLTIEGSEEDDLLKQLQISFADKGAIQCGYCIPGMIMAARSLLEENKKPSIDEIRYAIAGNLCRCTGYTKIVEAIKSVSEVL